MLAPLATMRSASAIDCATQRKMRGVTRAAKGIMLVISDQYMDDITRIIKSLENLRVLIDGVGETVKHEIKEQEGGFLRNFRCFNVRKYVDWKRCCKSWKRCCKSRKRV